MRLPTIIMAPSCSGEFLKKMFSMSRWSVINACHAVHNMDGVELTGALAHAAGNAGGGADLVGHSALILIGAHDHRLARAGIVDHNDLLGADVGAGTAACALVLVHLGHAVHNVDGIELTHLGAVAQADAGKGTL